MPDLNSLISKAASLSGIAIRSFAATLMIFLAAGVLLAGGSYYVLRGDPLYGAIAAAVALAEALTTGVLLGAKRALVLALMQGFTTLRLGQWAVRLIFQRLLGVAPGEDFGQRGGRVARIAERIPLAQAEQRLTQVVKELTHASTGGGWFLRTFQGILLRAVEKYTLAQFRAAGRHEGGVDLMMVQEELDSRIDALLTAKLRAGLNLWTFAAVVGLPTLVFAQTYVIIALLGR